MMQTGTFIIKPITYTEHQVVGLMEIFQVISYVQKGVAGHVNFESQYLVE